MSQQLKDTFPLLQNTQHKGDRFVYLDSAATTQKPATVIAAEKAWYERFNANIHRGSYDLAEQATKLYEQVRIKTAQHINAVSPKSIVFTSGTTESINMIARAWARHVLQRGDTIVLTEMEHHSNIVPWRLLAQELELHIEYWPIQRTGELQAVTEMKSVLQQARLLCITHASNVLGVINPLERIIAMAHELDTAVVVDGAQAAAHMQLDMQVLQPDFYCFSAHKMLGPTGLGVAYVDHKHFGAIQPFLGGGEMIQQVTKDKLTFKPMPWLLEAGTKQLAQVFAFGEALDYMQSIGMKKVAQHDRMLSAYMYEQLRGVDGVRVLGSSSENRIGIVSFVVDDIHAHDLATLCNDHGIAVRAGHHCAMPLHDVLGASASVRVSTHIYNDKADIDYMVEKLKLIINEWKKLNS